MRPFLHKIAFTVGLMLACLIAPVWTVAPGSLPYGSVPYGAARCGAAEVTPSSLVLSNYRVYSVHMDTTVKAPASGPRCINVRVWHALPTNKPWSQRPSPWGTIDQNATPAALIEAEEDKRSTHILFNAKAGQAPGEEKHYVTDFRVISPDRRFDNSYYHVDWPDVLRINAENKITFPAPSSEVAALAEKLRYNRGPVQAVIEFCRWEKDNLTYDGTVSTDGNDVNDTINKRRGHCWHYMALLRALCNASGLQCRPVEGLNLFFPDGKSTMVQSRSDYTNGHVWAEVYFPEVGWIEVEPNSGDKCFSIPSSYIQNNTKFQNYAVWITEQDGEPRIPKWILRGSEYVNEYGVAHKITYTESRR